ncbi:ParB/RepB/Spo0J family partition protein [uncultured Bacteroides sp.]|uniref:ParB/RepB/Spo0J family partition protein n=1 Tax=uncultured Bacteroides sp. TaxID=162156 RepID=UPI0026293A8A|nr:ParB/RepB/Spo0J family partition protein [uncultured Bacteroides sp.]
MEATDMKSVEKNIVSVALADIQPSSYNPRKTFDEASLAELADSIRQQGVLQPIGVRPIAENRFEIIFGERRYRASLMAGLETIPAVIYEVSDEVAEEMAVTENLQRKDVTPIEEANAYQKLMESGRHDVHSLAVQFGKSEDYIRTRLKFTNLIPEIAALLETDEITISVANEICRYGKDIQSEVYDRHLKEGVMYNSWRGMKAADVAKYIERDFTTDLEYYSFDKTLCMSCPHNTNNMTLFCEGGCGKCANRKCLEDMNAAYLVEQAMKMLADHPTASLAYSIFFTCNDTTVKRLEELSYEVERLLCRHEDYPELPEVPEAEDYETMEDYEAAQKDYEQEQEDYKAECEDILRRSEEGEISLYVLIGDKDLFLGYVKNSATNTANGMLSTEKKELTPLEKLEKQDKRNKEIAFEKTVADTKKQILEVDTTETKFGSDEDKMIYYFLLSYLRREHYAAVGIDSEKVYCLSDKDKLRIIENLNGKAKAVIRRDFLISEFQDAPVSDAAATLLLQFAEKHMPEALAEIRKGYDEVYEKRHQRIEEKKAVLAVQDKAKQETEQQKEPQPDETPQADDVAA